MSNNFSNNNSNKSNNSTFKPNTLTVDPNSIYNHSIISNPNFMHNQSITSDQICVNNIDTSYVISSRTDDAIKILTESLVGYIGSDKVKEILDILGR